MKLKVSTELKDANANHSFGTLLTVLGMVIISPDSLLVKILSSSVPVFTLIFYKYSVVLGTWIVGFTVTSFVFPEEESVWAHVLKLGRLEYISGCVFGSVNVLLNYAFYVENVGIVLIILAINPAFTAVFSYFLLHETIPSYTLIACVICVISVVFKCWGNLSGDDSDGSQGSVDGVLAALGASVAYGLYFVLLRIVPNQKKHEQQIRSDEHIHDDDDAKQDASVIRLLGRVAPCNIIGSVFVVVVTACFIRDLGDLDVVGGVFLYVQGGLVNPAAFLLMTVGPAYIPAYEVWMDIYIYIYICDE
jgi:drug/metabolite transporter (DMT)-like permease